ncbi:MAG: hypothetical protein IPL39_05970 [Opitutaceae bacterium]|nr:hypothetical protein [Opitutaceae bacterium]
MSKHNCSRCAWRAKYDAAPRSFLGRLWRWHIGFCPGWKAYLASQSEAERRALAAQYSLHPPCP